MVLFLVLIQNWNKANSDLQMNMTGSRAALSARPRTISLS
jgi:hypothetical protein